MKGDTKLLLLLLLLLSCLFFASFTNWLDDVFWDIVLIICNNVME